LIKLHFGWVLGKRIKSESNPKNDARWEARFKLLKAFKDEKGHCKVPQQIGTKEPKWGGLDMWVSGQRQRRETMLSTRRERLDDLGFMWLADNCNEMYRKLVQYWEDNGTSHVGAQSLS
jgi:hypothetical protein